MIDPVALLKDYHAALNAFDLIKAESLFDDKATYKSPGLHGALVGRSAIMKAMRDYFAEFTDQVSEDSSVVKLQDNSAQATWHLTATSNKTGAKIQRFGTEKIVFTSNGLIASVEVLDQG